MKMTTTENTVESSETFKEVSFGIKESGMAHILGILRSKLYSNKVLAVIREYACNAQDEHAKKNSKKPIHITLPNAMDANFKVRDFGPGLSMDDVFEIYIQYGESTKRNTNKCVGMLGIGSKAGFAYADSFLVTSFYQGTKTTYNCYIDPSKIGKVAVMASEPTDEADGVEVTVPVKEQDMRAFRDNAVGFFRHWKIKPTVSGYEPAPDLTREKPSYEGGAWRVYEADDATAIMGNVPYPIDRSQCKLDNDGSTFLGSLEIDFQIGELDIAANREALEYTEHTISSIQRHVKRAQKEMLEQVNEAVAKATNLFDATMAYGILPDFVRGSLNFEWQGQKLIHRYYQWKDEEVYVCRYHKNYKDKIKTETVHYIDGAKTYWVADCRRVKDRVRDIMLKEGTDQCFVLTGEADAITLWAAKHNVPITGYKKLSAIPVLPREKNAEAREKRGIRLWDYSDANQYLGYRSSLNEFTSEIGSVVPDCYIQSERKEFRGNTICGGFQGNRGLIQKLARVIGKFKLAVIPASVKKIPNGWVEIGAYAQPLLQKIVDSRGIVNQTDKVQLDCATSYLIKHKDEFPLGHIVQELADAMGGTDKDEEIRSVALCFRCNVPTENTGMKSKVAELTRQYPLVAKLGYYDEGNTRNLINYVKAMDAYRPVLEAEKALREAAKKEQEELVKA